VAVRVVVHHRDDFKSVFGIKAGAWKLNVMRSICRQPRRRASRSAAPSSLVPNPCLRRASSTQNWRLSAQPPHVFPQIPATIRSSSLMTIASHSPSVMPVARELNA
jgi:hypothetical protein